MVGDNWTDLPSIYYQCFIVNFDRVLLLLIVTELGPKIIASCNYFKRRKLIMIFGITFFQFTSRCPQYFSFILPFLKFCHYIFGYTILSQSQRVYNIKLYIVLNFDTSSSVSSGVSLRSTSAIPLNIKLSRIDQYVYQVAFHTSRLSRTIVCFVG